jgi:hypothetical protein
MACVAIAVTLSKKRELNCYFGSSLYSMDP